MDEQTVREIAETAFKRRFGDVKIASINVKPDINHDDEPIVYVNIIYEGPYERLNQSSPNGTVRVRSEIFEKVWWENGDHSLGYPLVHFISRLDIGRRDPATVGYGVG